MVETAKTAPKAGDHGQRRERDAELLGSPLAASNHGFASRPTPGADSLKGEGFWD